MGRVTLDRPASLSQPKGAAGFEQHRKAATATNRKFYAVGAIILIAAVTIVIVAMQGSSVYYIPLAEFNTKHTALAAGDKEVRVAGKVLPGSITKNAATGAISFTAFDRVEKSQTMKVVYSKIPPDTFKDEAEVVVTGTYANGVFTANDMLAKCPSKYSSSAETN